MHRALKQAETPVPFRSKITGTKFIGFHGIFGFIALICSEFLMLKGIEPFSTWFYSFAWWSYFPIPISSGMGKRQLHGKS